MEYFWAVPNLVILNMCYSLWIRALYGLDLRAEVVMKDFGVYSTAYLSWHSQCAEISRRDTQIADYILPP